MFRLKAFSPLVNNSRLYYKNLFKFSKENKPTEAPKSEPHSAKEFAPETKNNAQETVKNSVTKAEAEKDVSKPYQYNPSQFQQINSEAFMKRMEKIEQQTRFDKRKPIDSLKFPIFLCLGGAFLYHCWVTMPYNVVFK